jgi:hypothetical protein
MLLLEISENQCNQSNPCSNLSKHSNSTLMPLI